MNCSTFSLAAYGLILASSAPAQNDPNWLPYTPSSAAFAADLDFAQNPVFQGVAGHPRPIWVANASKMPSDPPGTFTVSFTVRGLRGFGNPGFAGMLIAKWTPGAAQPVVLTNEAAAANDLFVDYNLVLEPITKDANGNVTGGRYGTFDRFRFGSSGLELVGSFLSARADDTQPFGPAMEIRNMQGQTADGADPAVGHVDGALKLFYFGELPDTQGNPVVGIYMDDLLTPDTAPTCAGNPVLVARSESSERLAHAAMPVNGSDGETKGLFLAMGNYRTGSDQSDIYFAADLDPDTPNVHVFGDGSTWYHGGGSAGGTILYKDTANEFGPLALETAFVTGDVVAPGERATVDMFAWSRPGTSADVVVFADIDWLPQALKIPGTLGLLGVRPAVSIGYGRIADADQTVSFAVDVPPQASIRGLDLQIQGLAIYHDATGNRGRVLTNTAQIRVR